MQKLQTLELWKLCRKLKFLLRFCDFKKLYKILKSKQYYFTFASYLVLYLRFSKPFILRLFDSIIVHTFYKILVSMLWYLTYCVRRLVYGVPSMAKSSRRVWYTAMYTMSKTKAKLAVKYSSSELRSSEFGKL